MSPLPRARTRALLAAAAVPIVLSLSACGPVDVTPQRLEASISAVFPNYYVQQQAILGRPPVAAADLGARASCDKGGPNIADSGAGNDWICYIDWTDPTGLHYTDVDPSNGASKFELKVSSNGCYIAGGSSKTFGPLQIQRPDGTYVNNPVFEFDGCFDVYDGRTSLVRALLPTAAPPTAAPPTVAPPTLAPPTLAPPTVAPPTVAPPTVAPPTVAPTAEPAPEPSASAAPAS